MSNRNLIEFSIIIAFIVSGIVMMIMRIGDNAPAGFIFVGVIALIGKAIVRINKSN